MVTAFALNLFGLLNFISYLPGRVYGEGHPPECWGLCLVPYAGNVNPCPAARAIYHLVIPDIYNAVCCPLRYRRAFRAANLVTVKLAFVVHGRYLTARAHPKIRSASFHSQKGIESASTSSSKGGPSGGG
jgi:hypothetical protein